MKNNPKGLGEAEPEIMQAIWSEDGPVTSVAIREKLRGRRDWQLSSLMSSLYRLEEKEFVKCTRGAEMSRCSATVSENGYKAGRARISSKGSATIRRAALSQRFTGIMS